MNHLTKRLVQHLMLAKAIFLRHPEGLSDATLATLMGVKRQTAHTYRVTLDTYEVAPHLYSAHFTPGEVEYAESVLWRQKDDEARRRTSV